MRDKALFLDGKTLKELQVTFAKSGIDPGDVFDEPVAMPPGAKPIREISADASRAPARHPRASTPPSDPRIWS